MSARRSIDSAIRAQFPNGSVDRAAVTAVRKGWKADRATLIDAEENNRGWMMQCGTHEATIARLSRERRELRDAVVAFLDAPTDEARAEFVRLRDAWEGR